MTEIVVIASQLLLERNSDLLSRFRAKSLLLNQIIYYPLEKSLRHFLENKEIENPALIFSSQNAIFSLDLTLKKYPEFLCLKNLPCYVIGDSSAKLACDLGFQIALIARDGYGDSFGDEIASLLAGRWVLYFRAKRVSFDLKLKFSDPKGVTEIIAYENQSLDLVTLQKQRPKEDSIIIFTAPSHFQDFIQNFGWDPSYQAIAIGKTTFASFKNVGKKFMSTERSLLSCLQLSQALAEGKAK